MTPCLQEECWHPVGAQKLFSEKIGEPTSRAEIQPMSLFQTILSSAPGLNPRLGIALAPLELALGLAPPRLILWAWL